MRGGLRGALPAAKAYGWVSQPDYGEQALEFCDLLVTGAAVDVVVVDSVAALVSQNEINGEMGEVQVGLRARLIS
ncbi:recA DNA recombination protein [Desulfofundulus thermosubterraneus DSM 16057]|uniref:Protein RecA n=1 Tax=Desulfofundulus thermosubterraneus DSM 16057 TaxID=1121432 RepID=A0A1M6E6Y3_9FIRM|nr:recA DNA recombination protein [Desulfofundulus thermosubterraneus DSM 16057]